jgi:hypothetical protein
MKKEFLDLQHIRQAVAKQEEALKVKTGVRSGAGDPPIYPLYGIPI